MQTSVLDDMQYRGNIIVFAGSTKVWNDEFNTPIAEFDGLIIIPSSENEIVLKIVEAKNMTNGNKVAKKQLQDRLKKLCRSSAGWEFVVDDINNDGAVASIKTT